MEPDTERTKKVESYEVLDIGTGFCMNFTTINGSGDYETVELLCTHKLLKQLVQELNNICSP